MPGLHERGKALFLMIFGVPFVMIGVGLFIFAVQQLSRAGSISDAGLALFVMAFSLPFGGLGGFLAFGPLVEARSARHVRYALTDRAAYVARSAPFARLKVYPILPSSALELELGTRAFTVWLHVRKERSSDGDQETVRAGFENIAEGEKVYHLIRDLQRKTDT